MKKKHFLTYALIISIFFSACKRENVDNPANLLPQSVYIDIPSSISQQTKSDLWEDSISAPALYNTLRIFVNLAERAEERTNNILEKIRKYNLNRELSFAYRAGDGRVKELIVEKNKTFNGKQWQYQMTITDAQLSVTEENDAIAMQMYWETNPQQGVIIIKPSVLNFTDSARWKRTMIQIEYQYDETFSDKYQKQMVISISNHPTEEQERFAISNMMMFLGENRDRIDLYGTSIHPNAWILIPSDKGLACTFAASAFSSTDIAVAEAGITPQNLNSSSRDILLHQFSLKNSLKNYLTQWFLNTYGRSPTEEELTKYLNGADSPAYYNHHGFTAAGSNEPDNMYKPLKESVQNLTPYNPNTVLNLRIEFHKDDIE